MHYTNVLFNHLKNKVNLTFENSVPASRKAKCFPNTKTSRLLLFKGVIGVYYEIHKNRRTHTVGKLQRFLTLN
jgi:hypothetical protein